MLIYSSKRREHKKTGYNKFCEKCSSTLLDCFYFYRSDLSDQMPNGNPDRITQGINNVIAAIVPRLKDFHDLLVNPPKVRSFKTN